MISSPYSAGEQVKDVRVTEHELSVDLMDGRTITVPLVWFPRLLHATAEQRRNWQRAGAGFGIHWPDVDEDISTQGLLLERCSRSRIIGSHRELNARPTTQELRLTSGHGLAQRFALSGPRVNVRASDGHSGRGHMSLARMRRPSAVWG